MTDILLIILIVLMVIALILITTLLTKKQPTKTTDEDYIINSLKAEIDSLKGLLDMQNKYILQTMDRAYSLQSEKLSSIEERIDNLLKRTEYRLVELQKRIEEDFKYFTEMSNRNLAEMRLIVDEKLQSTLEKRLEGSYKIIADNLDMVSKGIGDVRRLAESVGDVKKVFSNVKLRGTWGETQLGSLLEQMLSTEQFCKNFRINPLVDAFVDYAVVLPGKDGEITYLPIDSKFPIEEYQRLLSTDGDVEAYEKSKKSLFLVIKKQAEDIATKYILPPKTTDFAIMYLPVEGLYAEVLKNDDLMATLQKLRIMACGPTNLGALLNSLQTGFKTLAIEKRSSELWQLLSAFKTEFIRFNALLEKTGKKLQEAQDTIESAHKKTRTIERKLKNVDFLSGEDADDILDSLE